MSKPPSDVVALGVSIASMPRWVQAQVARRADFEQLLNEIRMMTAASSEDIERLRIALSPEVNSDWVERPGTWAHHAACQGITIDELIATANEAYGKVSAP